MILRITTQYPKYINNMKLNEQIVRIQSMMGQINENKKDVVERVLSFVYPNFSKENIEVVEKQWGYILVFVDKTTSTEYAKYWTSSKELQLNEELFSFVEKFTNDVMFDRLISWFNINFHIEPKKITF